MHVRSRRDFLKKSALLSAALAAIPSTPKVHASENNELKIGLVGCGGRGCGAAGNALDADPNVKLICAADVFPTRGKSAIEGLREKYGDRVDVPEDRFFDGFDGYKKVLEQDIDIALLVTPQHFRPTMIKAAIDAGKHVFAEKPVAVDGVGIKMIQEAGELAKQKGLNIVGGLVNRYGASAKEVISRIADGAIGEVVTARGDRMGGSLWM